MVLGKLFEMTVATVVGMATPNTREKTFSYRRVEWLKDLNHLTVPNSWTATAKPRGERFAATVLDGRLRRNRQQLLLSA